MSSGFFLNSSFCVLRSAFVFFIPNSEFRTANGEIEFRTQNAEFRMKKHWPAAAPEETE
jgi:hypothetical protein